MAKKAISEINVKTDSYILDLCCGTDDWTVLLAERVSGTGKVVGVDFSTKMLKLANEKIKKQDFTLNVVRYCFFTVL